MKTVKQIAEENSVSKQTIHRIVRKNSLETFPDGNRVLIPDDSEKAIIEALTALQSERERPRTSENDSSNCPGTSENVRKRPGTVQNDSGAEQLDELRNNNRTLSEENKQLTAENRALSAQVELLQSQLGELRADKQYLKEHIDSLTAALQAAQALHGIEKQQAALEAASPAPAQSERQQQQATPAQDPTRRSERRSPAPAPSRSGTRQRGKLQNIIQEIKNRLK